MLFYDIAFFHHEDDVSIFYRRKTMGDDKTGPSFHQCIHRLLNAGFGSRIYGTGGFVQNHDLVVCQDRPGDGQKLLLAFGDIGAAVGEQGVIPLGQGLDEVVQRGLFAGLHQLFRVASGLAIFRLAAMLS